jgi:hypothetical protein
LAVEYFDLQWVEIWTGSRNVVVFRVDRVMEEME